MFTNPAPTSEARIILLDCCVSERDYEYYVAQANKYQAHVFSAIEYNSQYQSTAEEIERLRFN